jgi:diguanylate cyclase (GGDEF)-like protein
LTDLLSRRRTDPGTQRLPPPPVRVLLVDDDDGFRTYLASIIRHLGCTVTQAADGEEAFAKLASSEFDLLLSDFEMPRLDGLELISRVRETKERSSIYAVMMTAHSELESKVTALAYGYDDFLPKGCTEIEVVARIAAARRMLARQRQRDFEVETWRELATQDELTRVSTRRAFLEEARRLLATDHRIAVALFDLDDFKSVNDNWGHLTGDRVLRDVGALFLSCTRETDLVARFGGDEFVLLMVDLTPDEAICAAERVASGIGNLQWTLGTTDLRIGATSGLGHSSLLTEPTVEQLLDTADRDLYAKKWLHKHPPQATDTAYHYPQSSLVGKVVELPARLTAGRVEEDERQVVPPPAPPR